MHKFLRIRKSISIPAFIVMLSFLSSVTAHATITPSSDIAAFATQQVGTASAPISVTLTNTGISPSNIVRASLSTTKFSYSGPSLPVNLAPGDSVVFNIVFMPDAAGSFTDTLTFTRGSGRQTSIALSGIGVVTQLVPTSLLNPSSTTLDFGSVLPSANTIQAVTFINAGTSQVTIVNVSVAGPGFNASGISAGTILNAGDATTLNVSFTPAAIGSVTGSVTVTSDATNSPNTIILSGTGTVPTQTTHSVALAWTPSTSPTVVGYNTYFSTTSGGPYAKLVDAPVNATTYTDTTVQSGQTYYYVVTAIDESNVESTFSEEASAIIP